MTTDKNTEHQSEMIASPVVRIDALDENYVEPLREFFALNGCQVFINSSPNPNPTYHLVVGDLQFVKHIVDSHKIISQKAINIIWETSEDEIESIKNASTKYALIDPKPISGELLGHLCNFFFTSTQRIKNFQTLSSKILTKSTINDQPTEKTHKQREPISQVNSPNHEDQQRIMHTISQIFFTGIDTKKHTFAKQKNHYSIKKYFVYGSILIFCVLLPILLYVVSLSAMVFIVYRQSVCFTKPTTFCLKEPKNAMASWSSHTRQLLPYTQLFFKGTNALTNENIITAVEKISATLSSAVEIENVASDFSKSLFTTDLSKEDTSSTVVQVEKLKTQIFSLHTNIDMSYRLVDQIMEQPPFPLSISSIQTNVEKGIDILQIVRTRLQTAERLLLLYPYVAGYKEPLKLLFLFQNNTELRPTGGFIGSIMEASIEDGVITTMEVQDVYALDGQLRGHVDPPNPIREILKQEHWYLRDSNWNPNFEESAQKAMWFYEKETGKTVQGVIAVNSSIIIQILKLLGSIQLADTKDTITADNFYEKSFAYTQTDFFPGSTQKKDFLGSLVKSVMTATIGNKTLSGIQTFSLIDEALRNRNIQMYFINPEAQQLSKQFAWAGKLPSKTYCLIEQTPCLFDFNAIIESNLGVNKTNYYIHHEDTRDITITKEGKISETITRIITNTSNNQVGGGVYTNYMRFYIPVAAHVTNFTINNTAVPAKSTKKNTPLVYPYGELDTTLSDFSTIALAHQLGPNQKATISLQYEYTNIQQNTAQTFDMYIFGQKQSGINEVPTLVRVHYPTSWTIPEWNKMPSIILANEGYLEYNSTMLEDSDIHIRFIKE